MSESLAELFGDFPPLLAGHLLLSLGAIGIGTAISLPLGIVAARSPRLRGPTLAAAGVIQTIPSLALLALMVPVLGGRIGFLPAFIALTLYGVLPTLRNTVTGILDVDPAVSEAARGMGMTDRECLRRVELPLAMPVIIAGIRTATVWVVGTATLATPVGAPSLGHYIFMGLQTRNWEAVLFGCFFVAALAIALDQGVHALERASRTRNRRLAWRAAVLLTALVVTGLAPLLAEPLGWRAVVEAPMSQDQTGRGAAAPLGGTHWVVGSKGFTEQYILAELLRRQLEDRGATVAVKPNLGSTILFDALRNDTVDVAIDYSGTIWATVMKRDEPVSRSQTIAEVSRYLEEVHGIATLGPLGFENAYALAMDRRRAAALRVRSIADLARHAGTLTLGGDPEVFGRPEWRRVRDTYGLGAIRTRGMDSTFLYGAVRDGEVDVITAYSSDGRIAAFDLVVLADPKQAFPPYDALLLMGSRAARAPRLRAALRPLVDAIRDDTMRAANRSVDIDGLSPVIAGERLWRQLAATTASRQPDPGSGRPD